MMIWFIHCAYVMTFYHKQLVMLHVYRVVVHHLVNVQRVRLTEPSCQGNVSVTRDFSTVQHQECAVVLVVASVVEHIITVLPAQLGMYCKEMCVDVHRDICNSLMGLV